MPITKHYRKPEGRGGTRNPRNVSTVTDAKELAFNTLFTSKGSVMTPHEIAHELNTVWVDPDYYLIVKKKSVPEPNPLSEGAD